jgi:metallophosphoesterase superfamily enzyme
MTRAAEIAAASAGPIVAGAALTADGSGALWWEAERLLIVADLHFEKGSAFAARRVFLPPYDTAATLARLAAARGALSSGGRRGVGRFLP